MEMEEQHGWAASDYAWDPYRLLAVQDVSAAALHANTQQLGTQPDSLVPPVLPGPALPSAAASRAARAVCKVEGCQRLLRDEKPYYQRFLVCEEHMRSLSIEVNGQLCRFCQQCGKFESVEAFDSNKRSCRARLQEHNKRRRKMGVNSRSMRKHRRNAAAVSKASKAAQASASADTDAHEEDAVDQNAENVADAAMAPADGCPIEGAHAERDSTAPAAAQATAAAPHPNIEPAVMPASSASCSASGREQRGPTYSSTAGATSTLVTQVEPAGGRAADSSGCSRQLRASAAKSSCQPQQQQQQEVEVLGHLPQAVAMHNGALGAGAVPAAAGMDTGKGSQMLPAVTKGALPAGTAECWKGNFGMQLNQQQQQQHGLWPSGNTLHPPTPASPTISDIIADIPMADTADEVLGVDAASGPAAPLPASGVYESSLLYMSGAQQPLQALQPAATGSSSLPKCGPQAAEDVQPVHESTPAMQACHIDRKGGSSCSSSNARCHPVPASLEPSSCWAAGAAGTAYSNAAPVAVAALPAASAPADKVQPSSMFTEEDRRLLDQLLTESADIIGAALQPSLETSLPVAAAHSNAKRHRLQDPAPGALPETQSAAWLRVPAAMLPRSSDACADPAMPLPNIVLPPIVHRDDSAEDNRGFLGAGSNCSSDSGGSSMKRIKPRRGGTLRHAGKHSAQEAQAVQLLQQQAQYQQLQALQQQLHQAGPALLQPQASMAAAMPVSANSDAEYAEQDLLLDQQLQELMLQAGIAAMAPQQQPLGPANGILSNGSSHVPTAHAGQGSWGMAAFAFGGSGQMEQMQMQVQVQQRLQMQMQMQAYMAGFGVPPTFGNTAGSHSGVCAGGGMPGTAQWGRDGSLANQPTPWAAAAAAAMPLQQHMQQPHFTPHQLQLQRQQQAVAAALAVANGGGANATYQSVDSSVRLSVKIHGAEPHQLQPEMLPRLHSLLGSNANTAAGAGSATQAATAAGGASGPQVEVGYMRPGCVHLVLQLRSAADVRAAAEALAAAARGLDASSWQWALMRHAAAAAVSSSGSSSMGVSTGLGYEQQQQQAMSLTVQIGDQSVLLIRKGKPDAQGAALLQQLLQHRQMPAAYSDDGSERQQHVPLPRLRAVLPCCISSCSGAVQAGRCHVLAIGTGLLPAGDGAGASASRTAAVQPSAVARCQGMFLGVEAVPATPMQEAGMLQLLQHARCEPHSSGSGRHAVADAAADCCVSLVVQGLQPYGLVHMEFMQGALLSDSRPLLVVDDDAVAAEIQCLQAAMMAGGQKQAEAQQVLVDFGRLLDFRAASERHADASQHLHEVAARRPNSRRSSSAPMPQVVLPVTTASTQDNAIQSCDAVLQMSSWGEPSPVPAGVMELPVHQPAGSHASSSAACSQQSAGLAAAGASRPAEPHSIRPPSRTSSSSSLRDGLRRLSFSLPCFTPSVDVGGASHGDSSEAGSFSCRPRRSFALESARRDPTQGQTSMTADLGRRTSPPVLSAGRTISASSRSSSFSRRLSFGLEAAVPEGSDVPASSVPARGTPEKPASHLRLSLGRRLGSCSWHGSSNSFSRMRSLAVDTAVRPVAAEQAGGEEAAAVAAEWTTSQRRSFSDLVSSRSIKAFTRSFTCGKWPGEEQLQQQSQHAAFRSRVQPSGPSCVSGPSYASDPGAAFRSRVQPSGPSCVSGPSYASDPGVQVVRSLHGQPQIHDFVQPAPENDEQQWMLQQVGSGDASDAASEEGDSVSSFTLGVEVPAQPAVVSEHPLLTLQYKGVMMEVGSNLLAFFLDRGWPASARMVLTTLLKHAAPLASFSAIAAAVEATRGEGLGVLHRAVRSGQLSMVTEVLGWGVQHRICIPWDAKGPHGLTPLHLLALSGNRNSGTSPSAVTTGQPNLAALVLHASPGLCAMWFNIRDAAGLTPAQYAINVGSDSLNHLATSSILLTESRAAAANRQAHSPPSARPMALRHVVHPVAVAAAAQAAVAEAVVPESSGQPGLSEAAATAGGVGSTVLPQSQLLCPADMTQSCRIDASADPEPVSGCGSSTAPESSSATAESSSAALESSRHQATARQNVNDGSSSAADQAVGEAVLASGPCGPSSRVLVSPVEAHTQLGAAVADSGAGHRDDTAMGKGAVAAGLLVAPAAAAAIAASSTAVAEAATSSTGTGTSAHLQLQQAAPPSTRPLLQSEDEQMSSPQDANPAVAALAGLFTACHRALDDSPELCQSLLVLNVLRAVWVVLLLEAVLHGSVGLMLVSVGALTITAMLRRLLSVLRQPGLSWSLTDACELQRQLQLLLRCVCSPLTQPHSRFLLTFASPLLEEQYKQVLAESRQQTDATISGTIKAVISALPLLVRCGRCQLAIMQLVAAPDGQWNLPTTHLLAAAVAAGLPLIAALCSPGYYHSIRDSVLGAAQVLLLVILRKPLLAAAAGGTAMAAASSGAVASAQLFHGCIAVLLLLLFRQRLCWAAWQAVSDAALGLILLCWEWSTASGAMPALHSWLWALLHVLLPVLVLPLLYLREKVDRQMVLASVSPPKQAKLKDV